MNNQADKSSEEQSLREEIQQLISVNQSYCDLRRLLPKISHLHCLRSRTTEGNGAPQRKRFIHLVSTARALTEVDRDQFDAFSLFLSCLTEDDDLQGAEALKEATRLISIAEVQSRKVLGEIKLKKRRLASLKPQVEPSSFEVESELWKDLKAVIRAMEQVVSCEKHLENVRSEAYILKYTEKRCDLNVQITGLKGKLTQWRETNENAETNLWEKHGELVQVILAALDAKPTDALVSAMKEDVMKAQGKNPNARSLPQLGRRSHGSARRKSVPTRNKPERTKHSPGSVGLGLEIVGRRSG